MLLRGDWPGLTTKPITDESWEGVRVVFLHAFKHALDEGIYPKKLIIKELTEQAVRLAFDKSVALQIKVQQEGDGNRKALGARTAMREFAGRVAVSALHR